MSSIHFNRIFHEINHPKPLGYLHDLGHPHMTIAMFVPRWCTFCGLRIEHVAARKCRWAREGLYRSTQGVPMVNPGLINPKRLFNWEGTIYVPYGDYLEGYFLINKPWFIKPGLTLHWGNDWTCPVPIMIWVRYAGFYAGAVVFKRVLRPSHNNWGKS